ncbi:hypothetical protein [Dinghuibacter silviterrae]|uniref:PH (Pleckstrin Homology) domain-containing protein n=1 Tax=Dinghuibacter silviterrae TaxID=1539049 RepID=A0A4R8DQ40_9BACT|nr:hypothetical protein [Dinghuibacter silviterrae]TDW99240.1 hypothetical protein EDB95_0249 [Dinghuibacter silviterrae]
MILFAVGLVLALWFVKSYFFNDTLNYSIHIDVNGMTIDDILYKWSEVDETAILDRSATRGRSIHTEEHLVLTFKSGGYQKFDLRHFVVFWGITGELSRYIEFFKAKATALCAAETPTSAHSRSVP